MTGENTGPAGDVDLLVGTDHCDEYGNLRRCYTTDCGVTFTSREQCGKCQERTSKRLYGRER